MMPRITSREAEVAALIAEGYSSKMIAARLSIATATVNVHVRNIQDKTESLNRAHIAARWVAGDIVAHD